MTAKPLKVGATYDDLVRVPEHFVAEMFDGELYASPRPAFAHARAASVLGVELGGPFDRGRNGPGGWLILDEPELHFGNDVLVPDLAGWRRERLPSTPKEPYLARAPDALYERSLAQIAEHHGEASVRALPFDAIELELRALWS